MEPDWVPVPRGGPWTLGTCSCGGLVIHELKLARRVGPGHYEDMAAAWVKESFRKRKRRRGA